MLVNSSQIFWQCIPASHQDGLVSSEKLSVHLYGHIGEDVPAAQAVEVEQDVACMACELNAVVCSRGHAVITCAKVVKGVINMENSTTDPLWAECRKKKQTNKQGENTVTRFYWYERFNYSTNKNLEWQKILIGSKHAAAVQYEPRSFKTNVKPKQ